MMNNIYESPLSSRYASKYMLELFSSDTRYQTWRSLWVSLAKAEMALGLPITQEQIDEMNAHISDIDYDCVRQREKEVRHAYLPSPAVRAGSGCIPAWAWLCTSGQNRRGWRSLSEARRADSVGHLGR